MADLVVTLNAPIDNVAIEFIHDLEKQLDMALGKMGFERVGGSKGDKIEIDYRRFVFKG